MEHNYKMHSTMLLIALLGKKKRKKVVQKENKKLTESQSGCNSLVLDSNKFTHHSIYLLTHFRKIKNLISFLALCHYRFNVFVT